MGFAWAPVDDRGGPSSAEVRTVVSDQVGCADSADLSAGQPGTGQQGTGQQGTGQQGTGQQGTGQQGAGRHAGKHARAGRPPRPAYRRQAAPGPAWRRNFLLK
jgi:hypothetical protein